jgi:hypothetical protein
MPMMVMPVVPMPTVMAMPMVVVPAVMVVPVPVPAHLSDSIFRILLSDIA